MDVRFDIETGWPSQVNLHGRVSALTRIDRVSGFKIGITSNPDVRASQYGDLYDEMVVLYESSSEDNVREMERHLVDYYRDDSDAERGGGGGRLGQPPYFLYVVLDHS